MLHPLQAIITVEAICFLALLVPLLFIGYLFGFSEVKTAGQLYRNMSEWNAWWIIILMGGIAGANPFSLPGLAKHLIFLNQRPSSAQLWTACTGFTAYWGVAALVVFQQFFRILDHDHFGRPLPQNQLTLLAIPLSYFLALGIFSLRKRLLAAHGKIGGGLAYDPDSLLEDDAEPEETEIDHALAYPVRVAGRVGKKLVIEVDDEINRRYRKSYFISTIAAIVVGIVLYFFQFMTKWMDTDFISIMSEYGSDVVDNDLHYIIGVCALIAAQPLTTPMILRKRLFPYYRHVKVFWFTGIVLVAAAFFARYLHLPPDLDLFIAIGPMLPIVIYFFCVDWGFWRWMLSTDIRTGKSILYLDDD